MNLEELKASRPVDPEVVEALKEALRGLGTTSNNTANELYKLAIMAPETEQEYLLRRLNMLLNGPHPGPSDYVQVREDRKKWEAKNRG